MATSCDATLLFLHESFVAFNGNQVDTCRSNPALCALTHLAFTEVLTSEASCWEACKTKLQQLHEQWQQKGLCGANALGAITQYQAQITWQDMAPEQFSRFYRFVFHICREPGKRNVPMDLAVTAWRLIMPGRFRLLDRWCAFAAASQSRVVTEDTWRQVLDFSRTIHEDLSNYDATGAWAVLLDEFVEDLRASRRRLHAPMDHHHHHHAGCCTLYGGGGSADVLLAQRASGTDLAGSLFPAGAVGPDAGVGGDVLGCCGGGVCSFVTSLSPRCGSKRREPDVDMVAEQLSAMPLGAEQHAGGGACAVQHAVQGGHGGGDGAGCYQDPRGFIRVGKRQCLDCHPQNPQQQYPHLHSEQQQQQQQQHSSPPPPPQQQQHVAALQPQIPCSYPDPDLGVCGGGLVQSQAGGPGVGGRMVNGGQLMSCSVGSVEGDSGQGPAGTAPIDCWQDALGLVFQQHQHHPAQQHCQQQRRAIKARRSGLSDILKSAVSDALGF